jgi:ketosteroid isomerase-like protein
MATIVERLRDSQNAHDAEGMAALFADDYDSQQPVHPSRAFGGRAQVLQNWTSVFQGVPDFVSDLVSFTAAGDTEWAEWSWHGHHVDGSHFAMRGVTIMVISNDQISGARLYMEPVEAASEDIDAAVQELYQPPSVSPSDPSG